MDFRLIAFAAPLVASVASAQTYTSIPGGAKEANDITPDGEVIVGSGTVGGSSAAYYWRWKVDPSPVYIGGTSADGVSDDGAIIAGKFDSGGKTTGGLWTSQTGWVELGHPLFANPCPSPTTAFDISGDGSTIAGITGCANNIQGFVWKPTTGTLVLENLGSGTNWPRAISADAGLIVGWAEGDNGSTPAFWDAESLSGSVLDMGIEGDFMGVSDDGQVMLGTMLTTGPAKSAFYASNQDGYVFLGSINPNQDGVAVDISESRDVVVGYDRVSYYGKAWFWTPEDGLVYLRNYLQGFGLGVPQLGDPTAITPDGKTIIGFHPFGAVWVIELPDPEDCGFHKYGEDVTPTNYMDLDAVGDPSIGEPFTLVTQPTTSPYVITIVSVGESSFPELGGQILIDPLLIVTTIASFPVAGVASTALTVPPNPAFVGVEIFFQSVAEDFSQPDEWALSNGLELDICP